MHSNSTRALLHRVEGLDFGLQQAWSDSPEAKYLRQKKAMQRARQRLDLLDGVAGGERGDARLGAAHLAPHGHLAKGLSDRVEKMDLNRFARPLDETNTI